MHSVFLEDHASIMTVRWLDSIIILTDMSSASRPGRSSFIVDLQWIFTILNALSLSGLVQTDFFIMLTSCVFFFTKWQTINKKTCYQLNSFLLLTFVYRVGCASTWDWTFTRNQKEKRNLFLKKVSSSLK